MVITCLRCGATSPDPCCGGAVYQLRFFECGQCHSIIPNVKWSRLSVIDGYENRVQFRCTGCEEKVSIDKWVYTRDVVGTGEYSCPLCGKVWNRG